MLERSEPVAAHDAANLILRIAAVVQRLREVRQFTNLREAGRIALREERLDRAENVRAQGTPAFGGWQDVARSLVCRHKIATKTNVLRPQQFGVVVDVIDQTVQRRILRPYRLWQPAHAQHTALGDDRLRRRIGGIAIVRVQETKWQI